MPAWMILTLVFVIGLVLGGAVALLRSRAKLKVYKRFIESRLDLLNLPLASRVFRPRPDASSKKQDSHQAEDQRSK